MALAIFKALKGYPATIRFLDPPLHEFLPHEDAAQQGLAKKMGVPVEKIKQRVKELHEFNPMLGFRGCHLGIVYSEISEMQARAVFEAAAEVQRQNYKVKPEVMIPLVGFKKELDLQVEVVHLVAKEVKAEKKVKLNYLIGTMIEVPRGAHTANEIAETAEFFSFGTNDLTQTCLDMRRDDSGLFLLGYTELEIVKTNPFASIDQTGVGQLMKIAVEKGRSTRPDIKLGICGEHGDPNSVKFCHKLGLTYVSCSPFRVPVARLPGGKTVTVPVSRTPHWAQSAHWKRPFKASRSAPPSWKPTSPMPTSGARNSKPKSALLLSMRSVTKICAAVRAKSRKSSTSPRTKPPAKSRPNRLTRTRRRTQERNTEHTPSDRNSR